MNDNTAEYTVSQEKTRTYLRWRYRPKINFLG